MEYRVMRIAANSNGWLKPASGRLGQKDCGEFVSATGFGEEDWNFDVRRPTNGRIFAYARGAVSQKLWAQDFAIVLATYGRGDGWKMAGYYRRAKHIPDGTPLPDNALQMRCDDILELGRLGSLGGRYAGLNRHALYRLLHSESRYHHWGVQVEDVFVCANPVRIPPKLWKTNTWRMSLSYPIDQRRFQHLIALAKNDILAARAEDIATSSEDESDFPEGTLKSRRHRYRERDSQLVRRAKAAFRKAHAGRLYCQACGCDFSKMYGEDYIEAHHMVPVSDLGGTSGKTNISHLAMVCANCHRMLHRHRPWIAEIAKLPKVLLKNR